MIDKFLTGENVKVNGEIAGRRYILRTDLQLHVQSVPITTKVVSSNPFHGEVYSIQHSVIKFVSDKQQVSDFLQVCRFYPPIKLTATI